MAASAFIMIVLVGLAVDLGGKVHTQQAARNDARQAARAGAAELQGPDELRANSTALDVAAARGAANRFLEEAGLVGTVSVRNGVVVVEVTDTYDAKFLGIIGLNRMTVTGSAEARAINSN